MIKKVATHNGKFHADDVFAVATLSLVFASEIQVCRTRDEVTIATADIVVDVGGIHEEEKDRFDHHQGGGAGKRKNGTPYASFGLVWKKYGLTLCGNQDIVDEVDNELVQPVDAEDNGVYTYKLTKSNVRPFSISYAIHVFNSTWKEDESKQDELFLKCVSFAKEILDRTIAFSRSRYEAETSVTSIYKKTKNKQLIVFDVNLPARDALAKFPEPLFIIRPRTDGKWGLEAVKDDPRSFVSRKDMPKEWGGKADIELQKITGVKDAIFCHRGLHLAVTGSKEGAIALAKKALL